MGYTSRIKRYHEDMEIGALFLKLHTAIYGQSSYTKNEQAEGKGKWQISAAVVLF